MGITCMTAFASGREGDVEVISHGERWRRRLGASELALWTAAVSRYLALSDSYLDQLERLNLRDQTQTPQDLERAAIRLIGMANGVTLGSPTVQGLLDALFEIQQSILLELSACRAEAQGRSRGYRVVLPQPAGAG